MVEDLSNFGEFLLPQLKLEDNELVSVPGLPSSIRTLSLAENNLNEVPESLRNMTSLVDLDLSGNQIRRIPGWLGELPRLQTLNLSQNLINSIDIGLGESPNLQTLLLARNQLRSIPEEVLSAPSLAHMRLEGNSMTKELLMASPGWSTFDAKRQALVSKQIAGGMADTDRSICGLA